MPTRKEPCEFCGKDSERYMFAAFICGSDECLEKAMEKRGGPGGHMALKIHAEKPDAEKK